MAEYNRYKLQEHHRKWRSRLGNRCQFSGKVVGKEVRGAYQKYHFHHTSSDAYGHEIPGYNYILLSWWSHWFVHFIGGVFIPGKSITIQNRRAKYLPLTWLWRFPNPAQRVFHNWCRIPMLLRYSGSLAAVVFILLEING